MKASIIASGSTFHQNKQGHRWIAGDRALPGIAAAAPSPAPADGTPRGLRPSPGHLGVNWPSLTLCALGRVIMMVPRWQARSEAYPPLGGRSARPVWAFAVASTPGTMPVLWAAAKQRRKLETGARKPGYRSRTWLWWACPGLLTLLPSFQQQFLASNPVNFSHWAYIAIIASQRVISLMHSQLDGIVFTPPAAIFLVLCVLDLIWKVSLVMTRGSIIQRDAKLNSLFAAMLFLRCVWFWVWNLSTMCWKHILISSIRSP